jgi:hypothetical protein
MDRATFRQNKNPSLASTLRGTKSKKQRGNRQGGLNPSASLATSVLRKPLTVQVPYERDAPQEPGSL